MGKKKLTLEQIDILIRTQNEIMNKRISTIPKGKSQKKKRVLARQRSN